MRWRGWLTTNRRLQIVRFSSALDENDKLLVNPINCPAHQHPSLMSNFALALRHPLEFHIDGRAVTADTGWGGLAGSYI
jgi:hypothetical protein